MSLATHNVIPDSAEGEISSFAYDCGSGTDRVLVVCAGAVVDGSGDGPTGWDYNSVAMTKVTGASNEHAFGGRFGDNQVWFLINPTSGSNTLAPTYPAGTVRSTTVTVFTMTGADQTDPIGVVNLDDGESDTDSFTETTEEDNSFLMMAFIIRGNDSSPFTPGTGDTELSDHVVGPNTFLGHGQTVLYQSTTTAGSYTVSTTSDTNDYFSSGVFEIKEAVTAATDVLNRGLSNIEQGVISSGGGGYSGLHPIESGYIS
ncbi:MAG: hypothetical protein GY938_27150 [Ketobacter sp.]|nr:hypothetical protein [Ketobacter sp.]